MLAVCRGGACPVASASHLELDDLIFKPALLCQAVHVQRHLEISLAERWRSEVGKGLYAQGGTNGRLFVLLKVLLGATTMSFSLQRKHSSESRWLTLETKRKTTLDLPTAASPGLGASTGPC